MFLLNIKTFLTKTWAGEGVLGFVMWFQSNFPFLESFKEARTFPLGIVSNFVKVRAPPRTTDGNWETLLYWKRAGGQNNGIAPWPNIFWNGKFLQTIISYKRFQVAVSSETSSTWPLSSQSRSPTIAKFCIYFETLPKALRTQASTALPSNLVWIGGFGLLGLAQ